MSKKIVKTALLPGLIDIVENDGTPQFFFLKDGEPFFTDQLETSYEIFAPPSIESIPWKLARSEQVGSIFREAKENPKQFCRKLYADIRTYLENVVELPSDIHYDLGVTWAFHSYRYEDNEYSPYQISYAVPERGKSRYGKALIGMAYRGIYVESVREAYIIRVAKNYRASLFIDAMDMWRKASQAGSEDIFLTRFEKGAKVPRVTPDRGPYEDIVYYETFGATIIAVNEPVNEILETRGLQINMPESSRLFNNQIRAKDLLPYRDALVVYRALFGCRDFSEIEKPARGRLGDITRPLLQIVQEVAPDRENALRELIVRFEQERKVDRSGGIESQILSVVVRLQSKAERGQLPVKLVTDTFNESRPERFKYTYQFMGRKLASLGFGKASTSTGCSTILLDVGLITNLVNRYGVSAPGETGVAGVTGEQKSPPWARSEEDRQRIEEILRRQMSPAPTQ